jgi:adenylate cyclase
MPNEENSLRLSLYDRKRLVMSISVTADVEIGRQQTPDERPFVMHSLADRQRLVVAPLTETAIPRRHALFTPVDADSVRVTNLSKTVGLVIDGQEAVSPEASRLLSLPVLIPLGVRAMRLERSVVEEDEALNSLRSPTMIPGQLSDRDTVASDEMSEDTESLFRWLQLVSAVLQQATNSDDFFQHAARGIVDLIGLTCGAVVLRQDGAWNVAAAVSKIADDEVKPSERMLDRVLQGKRTLWQDGLSTFEKDRSLENVAAVIAAPILSQTGEVLGALYGDRRMSLRTEARIKRLEAMLVEALAFGVSAGLARLQQEKAAVAAEVKFEQFFTPQLARHLTAEPDLLRGRDAEVTLLFCDIREFSSISEILTPAETLGLISDVMQEFSDCVAAHAGVLVDYIGDELIAMWGAPAEQPGQATLACRAALDMLASLGAINRRWQARLGKPVRAGVGINTGVAHVGNTGSQRKFKYGPLGDVVNVASRVQGASKYLKTDMLITSATREKLDGDFAIRRLCSVKAVNIKKTLHLYEIMASMPKSASTLIARYEDALGRFEAKDLRGAVNLLSGILAEWPEDGPSLLLLSRCLDQMLKPKQEFSVDWELPGK